MEVQRTLETALMCIQAKVEMRPNMFTVLSMLLGESNMVITVDESHEDWLPNFTDITHRGTHERDESQEYSNGMSSPFVSKESPISLDPFSRSLSGDSGESLDRSSSESATDHTWWHDLVHEICVTPNPTLQLGLFNCRPSVQGHGDLCK